MPRLTSFLRTAVISTAAALLLTGLVEGMLRLAAPQDIRITYERNPPLAVVDSVLGHRLHAGCSALLEGPEFSVRYRIGEQGLRDRVHHEPDRRPAGMRILLVGDSFTFGAGNDYPDIWPAVFERTLLESGLDIDVVKAGVPGYDTRSEVLYLERLLPEYRPELVVLTLLPHDLFTNAPLDAPPGNGTVGREKATRLHLVRLASRILLSWDRLYTRVYLWSPRRALFEAPWGPRVANRAALTRFLLERGQDLCRTFGAEFLVLSPAVPGPVRGERRR